MPNVLLRAVLNAGLVITSLQAMHSYAQSIAQSSSGPCSANTVVIGDGNSVKIVCVINGKLETAQIRQSTPRTVDLRTILDPFSGKNKRDVLLNAEAVLTVESLSYEHLTEPALKARILKQSASLQFDDKTFPYQWFQFVNLGEKPGIGWLGREADAAPFTVDAGSVVSKTTQFRPEPVSSWQEIFSLIKRSKTMTVTFSSVISGIAADPNFSATFDSKCTGDLVRAQTDIAKWEKANPTSQAMYVHVFCRNSTQ